MGRTGRLRRRTVAALCAGALAVLLAAGGLALACSGDQKKDAPDEAPKQEQTAPNASADYGSAAQAAVTASEATFTLKAEGWTEKATKAAIKIEGKAKSGKDVSDEREIVPNQGVELGLDEGTYTISVTRVPVLEDGSTYAEPDPIDIEIDSGGKAAAIDMELVPVAVEALTADELKRNAKALDEAGNAEAAKAVESASSTHKKTADAPKAKAATVNGSAVAPSKNATADGKPNNGSANNASNAGKPSSNAGKKPSATKPSTGGSGGGTTTPTKPSKPEPPAHVHNWVQQYKTVKHDAVYENQWVSNWTYTTTYVCGHCGYVSSTPGEADAHQADEALVTGTGYNYYTNTTKVDNGHNESVYVQEAWTEQVPNGYTCSGCGATK